MPKVQNGGDGESDKDSPDTRDPARYFLTHWGPVEATGALYYLKDLEKNRALRRLQKLHGRWNPPPEVAQVLQKPRTRVDFSHLADTKEMRNLAFVLKMLGCPLSDDRPYKEFLKAQTSRQKRYWLYKHQGPRQQNTTANMEPICQTRLKRLNHFFPGRFTSVDNFVFFNNRLLTRNQETGLFYVGPTGAAINSDLQSDCICGSDDND